MTETELEIQRLWAQAKAEAGFAVCYEPTALSLAAEVAAEAGAAMRAQFPALLDRFDFALEWLASLWLSMENKDKHWRDESENGHTDLLPLLMLVTKAVNEALAVRRLVECGLGTPARVVLRALLETLLTAILLGARRNLVPEFQSSQTPEETRRFWYKHLRPGRLNDQLAQIEEETAPRLKGVLAQFLRDWRAESFERHSAVVHPTFISSAMNYVPDWVRGDTSSGLLGSPSTNRLPVLDEATKWLWYFSLLVPHAFFMSTTTRPALYQLDRDSEIDQAVWVGAQALKNLLLRHWDDLDDFIAEATEDPT